MSNETTDTDYVTKGKEAQLKAITYILYNFAQQVKQKPMNNMEINEEATKTAKSICLLMNTCTASALVALHAVLKKAFAGSVNDILDTACEQVIESFKEDVKNSV